MDSNIKDYWKDKPQEEAERAFERAVTTLMVVDFLVVIGLYIALSRWASQFWADCWIVAMYAYSLKSHIDASLPTLKSKWMEKIGHGKEDKQAVKEQSTKDIEDAT